MNDCFPVFLHIFRQSTKANILKFQNLLKIKEGYLKEILKCLKEKSDPSNRKHH